MSVGFGEEEDGDEEEEVEVAEVMVEGWVEREFAVLGWLDRDAFGVEAISETVELILVVGFLLYLESDGGLECAGFWNWFGLWGS